MPVPVSSTTNSIMEQGGEAEMEELLTDVADPEKEVRVLIGRRFDRKAATALFWRLMRSRTRMCPLKVNLKLLEIRLSTIFSHMEGSTHTSSGNSSISITI